MFTSSELPKFALTSTRKFPPNPQFPRPYPPFDARAHFSQNTKGFESFPKSKNLRFSSLQQPSQAFDLKSHDLERSLDRLAAMRRGLEAGGARGKPSSCFSNCNYKLVLAIYVVGLLLTADSSRISEQASPRLPSRAPTNQGDAYLSCSSTPGRPLQREAPRPFLWSSSLKTQLPPRNADSTDSGWS